MFTVQSHGRRVKDCKALEILHAVPGCDGGALISDISCCTLPTRAVQSRVAVCRATPPKAAAFPFFYIEPAKNTEVILPYVKNGFPVEQMAPIGGQSKVLSQHLDCCRL